MSFLKKHLGIMKIYQILRFKNCQCNIKVTEEGVVEEEGVVVVALSCFGEEEEVAEIIIE